MSFARRPCRRHPSRAGPTHGWACHRRRCRAGRQVPPRRTRGVRQKRHGPRTSGSGVPAPAAGSAAKQASRGLDDGGEQWALRQGWIGRRPTVNHPRTFDSVSVRQPGWLRELRGFAAPSRDGCAISWRPAKRRGRPPSVRLCRKGSRGEGPRTPRQPYRSVRRMVRFHLGPCGPVEGGTGHRAASFGSPGRTDSRRSRAVHVPRAPVRHDSSRL
jgi:hypothetical protein